MSTLQLLCADAFEKFADRTALLIDDSGEKITYGEADTVTDRIAARLRAAGVRPGDRICSWASLNLESILLAWACFSYGAVFVPLDHSLPPAPVLDTCRELTPRLFFMDHDRRKIMAAARPAGDTEIVIYDEPAGAADFPLFSFWLEEAGTFPPAYSPRVVSDEQTAVILYTSGSTGVAKGVMLSHGALYRSGALVVDLFKWQPDDVFMNLGDLHAMSGLRNTCIAILLAGCTAVIAGEAVRGTVLLLPEVIRRHRCTFIGIAPIVIRQLNMMADHFSPSLFSSLRAVLCTGGFLDPRQTIKFYDHTGRPVLNYYGLTETSGLCAGHGLDSFLPDDPGIGPAVGARLEIVDEHDQPLPAGRPGQLRVRSLNLMQGYYGRPDLTETVLRDGWFYTGDIAEQRPDGHFILRGRCRNIIKNAHTDLIHLEEVELALEQHHQVMEAAVHPYRSEFGDERMAAYIVPRQRTAVESSAAIISELQQFLLHKLGRRRLPHCFVTIDRLPRSGSGKLLRNNLNHMYLNEPVP
ncbi:MAG: acyl--CoA ligase [Desulfobacterales bacterium]|nr:acyl--CoA ligase [Desulfobacterales bacterium]